MPAERQNPASPPGGGGNTGEGWSKRNGHTACFQKNHGAVEVHLTFVSKRARLDAAGANVVAEYRPRRARHGVVASKSDVRRSH
jgi:hypothetical protein